MTQTSKAEVAGKLSFLDRSWIFAAMTLGVALGVTGSREASRS